MAGREVIEKKPGAHSLAFVRKGANRFLPGLYRCRCGEEFTSVKLFEIHRSSEYRRIRVSA